MIRMFQVHMSAPALRNAQETLLSGYIGQGSRVDEFEAALSVIMDDAKPLTVNSCTAALDLALHLCGVGPGDHVISTPQTCTATNGVIVQRGAHPVWADISPLTGNIDPQDVAKKITSKTKAIMAVDWGGRACDYEALRSHGLPVIEDAAHAFATRIGGRHVAVCGGDYVCFSFQAIKHLTTGDGGAIVVPEDQYNRARALRWYGLDRTSSKSFRCEQDITEIGYKYHMNDIAASIGLGNISETLMLVQRHVANARRYCDELLGVKNLVVPPFDPESSWWIYSLFVKDPPVFISAMAERGVECSPVHARNDKHSAFRRVAASADRLTGVDEFEAGHVAIPVGWWLSNEDVDHIIASTREVVS